MSEFRPIKTIKVTCKECGHMGDLECSEKQINIAAVNYVAKFKHTISTLEAERDRYRDLARQLVEAMEAALAPIKGGHCKTLNCEGCETERDIAVEELESGLSEAKAVLGEKP